MRSTWRGSKPDTYGFEPAPTQPGVIADACVSSLAVMSGAKAITVDVHARSIGTAMLDQDRLRQ